MQTDTDAPTLANKLWQELHDTEGQSDTNISALITTMLRQRNAVDKQPKQSFYSHTKWWADTTNVEAWPTTNKAAQQNKWEQKEEYFGDWTYPTNSRNQWNCRHNGQLYQKNYTKNDAKRRWRPTMNGTNGVYHRNWSNSRR